MNSINIFTSFILIWLYIRMNVVRGEAIKRATSYNTNQNTLTVDASSEQQQYLSVANPTIYSDARIPATYAEGIPYHDMPVNYATMPATSPLPKYCTQPLYTTQMNSGQNIYRAYDIPTATYDRMPLPMVQSAPVANLYMPPPPPPPLVKSVRDSYGLPIQPMLADPYTSNAFNY